MEILQVEKSTAELVHQSISILKEISTQIFKARAAENEKLLLSVQEVSKMLGGLDRNKVTEMCKDGTLKWVLVNCEGAKEKRRIFYDSVVEYVTSLKHVIHGKYHTNELNLLQTAKVSRSEIEKIGGVLGEK
jgi:hypothetical protein